MAPASPPPPGAVRATLIRAALLLLFVVAADVWATHQFAFGVTQLLAVGGIVTVLSSTALPAVKAILSDSEQKSVTKRLRSLARRALSTPVLLLLYVPGVLAALTMSSVTVTSEYADRETAVRVASVGSSHTRSKLLKPDSAIRFLTFTTPLGRAVRISAPGFIAANFTVYPLTGLTVTLGSDLAVAPTLLFRPEAQGLVALRNKGRFHAWTLPRTDSTAVLAETSGVVSAFLVGEAQALPSALLDAWKLELGCDTTGFKNYILFAWTRPAQLRRRAPSPGPGDQVHAEIVARSGAVVAQTDVRLGAERLIDVPVLDITPDATSCR